MLPQERYEKILNLFSKSTIVKVEDIMKAFDVSVETARRDLSYLEKQGVIKKIYGGATLVSKGITEPLSNERMSKNLAEKEAIGRKCSEFIDDGDSILIEIGTTTLQVAKFIKNKKNLTVMTNSIYVINELIGSDINLYIIGGKIRHEERAISGAVSMFELDNFNITKAIIGAGAVSLENGISDYNIEESLIRKKIINRSKQSFLVADHTKFGFNSLVNVCPLSSMDLIITGQALDSKMKKTFEENDINVVYAE